MGIMNIALSKFKTLELGFCPTLRNSGYGYQVNVGERRPSLQNFEILYLSSIFCRKTNFGRAWATEMALADEGTSAQAAPRGPRRNREVPETYFLKRPALWKSVGRAGLAVAAGLATAMWCEGWIKRKVAGKLQICVQLGAISAFLSHAISIGVRSRSTSTVRVFAAAMIDFQLL
jgi:hypothetical protein